MSLGPCGHTPFSAPPDDLPESPAKRRALRAPGSLPRRSAAGPEAAPPSRPHPNLRGAVLPKRRACASRRHAIPRQGPRFGRIGIVSRPPPASPARATPGRTPKHRPPPGPCGARCGVARRCSHPPARGNHAARRRGRPFSPGAATPPGTACRPASSRRRNAAHARAPAGRQAHPPPPGAPPPAPGAPCRTAPQLGQRPRRPPAPVPTAGGGRPAQAPRLRVAPPSRASASTNTTHLGYEAWKIRAFHFSKRFLLQSVPK